MPTLKSVKSAHPDWHVTLLTEPRGKGIKQLSNLIDDNITFDIKKQLKPQDLMELILLLRKGRYDIVLSSGSSSRVCVLLFLSGIAKRIGYDSGSLSHFLLTNPVKLNRDQYAAQMYHDLVSGLGINLPAQAPSIDLEENACEKMRNLLAQYRATQNAKPLVLIHPGTSKLAIQKGIIKTWSAQNWAELTARLLNKNCDVILCGGPDDDATISDVSARLQEKGISPAEAGASEQAKPASGIFINASGKTSSIQDLAALMHLSDLVVCVDSAPMHMASALQKRLVALFGPTDPAKLLLQNDRAVAIRDENASLIDLEKAPIKTSQDTLSSTSQSELCVQIPLDTVFQTAMDQLSRSSSQGNWTESPQS